MLKVGIPQGLFYYRYYPLWKTFFEGLGAKVVTSGVTNKRILENGLKKAVDEACLPVKTYHGHVLELADKVDFLFLPRLKSVEKGAYTCPKIIGVTDMIRGSFSDLPPIIDSYINLHDRIFALYQPIVQAGKLFTGNIFKILLSYRTAWKEYLRFRDIIRTGLTPLEAIKVMEKGSSAIPQTIRERRPNRLKIALLGHSYLIDDSFITMNLVKKLREMGVEVLMTEMLSPEVIEEEANKLPQAMFWTSGKETIGAAYHFLETRSVDGIIMVESFGCGPDSMVSELITRDAKRMGNMPCMSLIIDEHTGDAGVMTRLEAFVDMLVRRS
jgi:predicted nucleotide-binding protein (sugar kinase/HSP70/actin superfamily)